MELRDRLARRWAHRNLAFGRCKECAQILPDDLPGGFCSGSCAKRYEQTWAW